MIPPEPRNTRFEVFKEPIGLLGIGPRPLGLLEGLEGEAPGGVRFGQRLVDLDRRRTLLDGTIEVLLVVADGPEVGMRRGIGALVVEPDRVLEVSGRLGFVL